MFQFDPKGYLIPDRPLTATLEQFREVFVDAIPDESRLVIFEYFRQTCGQIMEGFQLQEINVWVDGSFATRKRTPNDLDLVVFMDAELVDQRSDLLKTQFSHERLQALYRIDSYWVKVYPENHTLYHATMADKAYWYNLFTRTYRNRQGKSFKKGFLDLTISSHEI